MPFAAVRDRAEIRWQFDAVHRVDRDGAARAGVVRVDVTPTLGTRQACPPAKQGAASAR